MWSALRSHFFVVVLFSGILVVVGIEIIHSPQAVIPVSQGNLDSTWSGPSLFLDQELKGSERELVIYGQDLIANTAYYLGPKGTVAQLTNGMNCQNCHLDAGSRPWGNNYGGVYSTYPKFRDRSGTIESIYKRVSDCMERSLGGVAVDSSSREFKAIYTYIKWLGHQVPKGQKPYGSGIEKLPFLQRAADPGKGQVVYVAKCQSCHQADGQGQWNEQTKSYVYPPLWGPHSYTDAAGLYRISNFAGYVRNNMPWNLSSHAKPALSVEDCWDVAAFVNSRPRPHKDQSADWPNHAKKPIDFPFGPYADGFSESQHKYGPYAEIAAAMKK